MQDPGLVQSFALNQGDSVVPQVSEANQEQSLVSTEFHLLTGAQNSKGNSGWDPITIKTKGHILSSGTRSSLLVSSSILCHGIMDKNAK